MMGLSISSRLIVSGKHPLYWVVSCERINLVLCFAWVFILDVWEVREVRLYGDNPEQTQSQIVSGELQGNTGGRSEWRCLGGETDTSCSYGACSFVNGSAHCSGCMVCGPSAMAATWVLLAMWKYFVPIIAYGANYRTRELCTCACSSIQEHAPSSVLIPLQTLVHVLHDSQRYIGFPFRAALCRRQCCFTVYRTRYPNVEHSNYRTTGENPTYSSTHSLPSYGYCTITHLK